MISNFSNTKKLVGVFCLILAVCLVGYLILKPTNGKQKKSDLDSSDNLVSIELSNSTNKQNKPSFFEKPQVASHTSAQALTVEEGIQNRYLDIFDEIPEANLYFEFLSKSGIPQQFHWRAFRVLHDIALRLGEYDHQVELLKSRLTEKELSGAETDPVTASELESIKREIKTIIQFRTWFQEEGAEDLRKYHPQLSDKTLETLFRFRPKEVPFPLPHVELEDVFLGTEP
jgi:hypothetical protein